MNNCRLAGACIFLSVLCGLGGGIILVYTLDTSYASVYVFLACFLFLISLVGLGSGIYHAIEGRRDQVERRRLIEA